jgi:hypothetical protein
MGPKQMGARGCISPATASSGSPPHESSCSPPCVLILPSEPGVRSSGFSPPSPSDDQPAAVSEELDSLRSTPSAQHRAAYVMAARQTIRTFRRKNQNTNLQYMLPPPPLCFPLDSPRVACSREKMMQKPGQTPGPRAWLTRIPIIAGGTPAPMRVCWIHERDGTIGGLRGHVVAGQHDWTQVLTEGSECGTPLRGFCAPARLSTEVRQGVLRPRVSAVLLRCGGREVGS